MSLMINFSVGPVQSDEIVLAIGGEQVPYFRTPEFSALMLENERLICKLANAPEDSRAVFITGSGTASMESVVMNTLTENDKALVVNGGSFGQRFADMLSHHRIQHTQLRLEQGQALQIQDLQPFEGKGYTAFLVNVHETSTGVHYDIDLIGEFCERNGIFLIVDAISSFLADPFDMSAVKAGVMITGSQKALACPPGISIIVLSPTGVQRVSKGTSACMYLDLKDALKNQERGQTPFTPAVGILRQIHARLLQVEAAGGADTAVKSVRRLAEYFRAGIQGLPFEYITDSMSNAVTTLHPTTASAYSIFEVLKDEYGIWICPNGGALRDSVFRVGHIGCLTTKDYDRLIEAFCDLQCRGII